MQKSTCAKCDELFEQPHLGRRRKYCLKCAPRNAQAAPFRPTMRACADPICATEFMPSRESHRYCSKKCTYRVRDARDYARDPDTERARCRRRYERDRDHMLAVAKAWAKLNPDIVRRSSQRRRAQKLDAASDPYTRTEIFERDGWCCRICGEMIDRRTKWPHPRSPTVDHIIPLSRGGTDLRTNVQTAHARCNLRKHASGVGDQLILVG